VVGTVAVTVWGPDVALSVTEELLRLHVEGVSVGLVIDDDEYAHVIVTVPAYPPLPVTVMVDVPLLPGEIAEEGLVADTVNVTAAAAPMVTLTVVVCTSAPAVPVTVMT
jgi:hypothetical protein